MQSGPVSWSALWGWPFTERVDVLRSGLLMTYSKWKLVSRHQSLFPFSITFTSTALPRDTATASDTIVFLKGSPKLFVCIIVILTDAITVEWGVWKLIWWSCNSPTRDGAMKTVRIKIKCRWNSAWQANTMIITSLCHKTHDWFQALTDRGPMIWHSVVTESAWFHTETTVCDNCNAPRRQRCNISVTTASRKLTWTRGVSFDPTGCWTEQTPQQVLTWDLSYPILGLMFLHNWFSMQQWSTFARFMFVSFLVVNDAT